LLELTEEHTFPLTAPGSALYLPERTTLPHHAPHCNTAKAYRPHSRLPQDHAAARGRQRGVRPV
jgi:hypothetical protein